MRCRYWPTGRAWAPMTGTDVATCWLRATDRRITGAYIYDGICLEEITPAW